MDNRRLDLGVAATLTAETFGQPGQRTFRILVGTNNGHVSLWLEKEQLALLGSYIGELLNRVPRGKGENPESDALGAFTGDLDVKVGSLALGFDSGQDGFILEASDFESPFDITSISCLGSRSQLDHVREQIEEIVAAGRPRCALCNTPLTGGPHFCPQSNGHAHLSRTE